MQDYRGASSNFFVSKSCVDSNRHMHNFNEVLLRGSRLQSELKLLFQNILDLSRQTYARCDAKGCDTYDAQYSRSGAYFVVDVPGRGLIAKIATDMSAFLEVATAGTTALVSFGSCQ